MSNPQLHALFHYIMNEKREHGEICLAMKEKKLKCLQRRIIQLAKRIEMYNNRKEKLLDAFRVSGEALYKKEWILANLENEKHVIKIKFMINQEESLKKMISQERSLLEQYL